MLDATKKLAVVTGASTGIGYELARQCAKNGFDLIVAANEPEIETAAAQLRGAGVNVETVNAYLSQTDGVDKLIAKIGSRTVDALLANADVGWDALSSTRIGTTSATSSTPMSPAPSI